MTIIELREKRAKAWEATKAFLESHRQENGTITAEDESIYNKMMDEIDSLGREIQRLEKQEAFDLELARAVSTPLTGKPEKAPDDKAGRASAAYKEDFALAMRGKKTVHNVLSEGIDADGGYLVPEEFETQIVTGLEEANVIRSIAKVIQTGSERKIPIAATHSVAEWTLENGEIKESSPTFEQKSIDAYKLTDLVKVSTELLQDSYFDLEGYIAGEFARAFGAAEEEAFCVGTGAGQPTGIFTASGGEVGTTTSSADITADNLIDLVYALKSPYRRNAVFLMKDTTVAAVRKLKDQNGAYLWQPSIQENEPDRLLGYKLYTSPYVPEAKSGSLAVAFGDFNNYWIADRMGRTVQRLNELYAGNGQIGFIATQRVDAKVILPEGIKLLKVGSGKASS